MLKKIYSKVFKMFNKKHLKQRLKEHAEKPSDLVGQLDILYGQDEVNNLFDVYYPKNMQNGKLPTIINIHGGGYVAGVKENCSRYCQLLAQKGFFVINMEYTKSETKGFPTPVYETFELFEYLKSHNEISKHINYDKLFLSGDSAGGHIVTLVANILKSDDLKKRFGVGSDLKVKGLILNSPVFGVFKFGKFRFLRNKLEEVVYNEYNRDSIKNVCNNLELLKHDFPPCIIFSAIADVLNIHTTILLNKAKNLGLSIHNYHFITGKNVGHDFTIVYPDGKEGKFAIEKTKEFINDVCNNSLERKVEKISVSLLKNKALQNTSMPQKSIEK